MATTDPCRTCNPHGVRVFALISDEAPCEAIDLYVRREDAERELRHGVTWVDLAQAGAASRSAR